jgi:glutamate-1-semialdehyde 2,1-aminomutase
MRPIKNSEALFAKAKTLFPGGVNSPVRAFKSVGGTPVFMQSGKGCKIKDADGNEYIDFCCSWGPLILGHANDTVLDKVDIVMRNGTSFGAPTALENELAELILTFNNYIEKIRFVSSGTEAVMSAIRLARGYTKKNKILKFEGCYHGHVDSLLVKAGSGLVTFGNSASAGVPESFANETITVPLNNVEALNKAFDTYGSDIAAVIIEPVPANNGLLLQDKSFLIYLKQICTTFNSLLIFDEVISGFRLSFCGAAGLMSIKPDIITYGKIIGGGFPVGAYGASADIMSCVSPEGPVYQAGTLSGNPVAMAAGIAQLTQCLRPNFYQDLETKTKIFVKKIQHHVDDKKYAFHIYNIGSIFWLAFSSNTSIQDAESILPESMNYFKVFYHTLLDLGVYIGPSGYEVGFVSDAHTEADLDLAAHLICKALDVTFVK